jgi:hypothetical protein
MTAIHRQWKLDRFSSIVERLGSSQDICVFRQPVSPLLNRHAVTLSADSYAKDKGQGCGTWS